jgi:hypothetical protein
LEELPPSSARFAAFLNSRKDDCITFMGRGDNVAVTWKVKEDTLHLSPLLAGFGLAE